MTVLLAGDMQGNYTVGPWRQIAHNAACCTWHWEGSYWPAAWFILAFFSPRMRIMMYHDVYNIVQLPWERRRIGWHRAYTTGDHVCDELDWYCLSTKEHAGALNFGTDITAIRITAALADALMCRQPLLPSVDPQNGFLLPRRRNYSGINEVK